MVFTPEFGTGYEQGSTEVIAAVDYYGQLAMSTSVVHTGVYSMCIQAYGSGAIRYIQYHTSAGSEIYIGVWAYLLYTTYPARVRVYLTDGNFLEVKYESGNTWNAYVNGGLVESGSVTVNVNEWHHLQVRFKVDDSVGVIQTKIDGVSDVDYSGDTKPGSSSTLEHIWLIMGGSGTIRRDVYYDDFVYGTGDWPGDIRFQVMVPDGDDTAEWIPSTGVDNYALVDEIPPSDADYVTSGSSGQKDLYTMDSWDGTLKTPQFLVQWIRAKKDSAGTRQLQMVVDSNGTEDAGDAFDLTTDYAYYNRVIEEDPDTSSAWTESAINALKAGMEST